MALDSAEDGKEQNLGHRLSAFDLWASSFCNSSEMQGNDTHSSGLSSVTSSPGGGPRSATGAKADGEVVRSPAAGGRGIPSPPVPCRLLFPDSMALKA